MSALAGINGDVWLSTSPSTALGSPEACTDSGDHTTYFTNTHQAWDPVAGVTVQYSPNGSSGWVTDSSGDYQFCWPVGMIIFTSARSVGTNNFIRVFQGSYFTLSALSGAHMWKAQFKQAIKEVTPFQASGSWAQNLPTIKSLTFSVDCYNQDARILSEMITSGISQINVSNGLILCQLWFNETGGDRWQFYGLPTSISENVASNDVDKQSVNFSASGPVYLVTSNTFTTTTVIQQ